MSSPALFEQLDYGIDLLFTNRDMVVTNLDERVVELLGVAAELCTIPHPDFRSQLRARLMDSARAATALSASEVMASDVICSRPLPDTSYPVWCGCRHLRGASIEFCNLCASAYGHPGSDSDFGTLGRTASRAKSTDADGVRTFYVRLFDSRQCS